MLSKESAPTLVTLGADSTMRSPVMTLTLGKLMLSDVPVATAMLPEKVVQVASADASPAFCTVEVADALHAACAVPATAASTGRAYLSMMERVWKGYC